MKTLRESLNESIGKKELATAKKELKSAQEYIKSLELEDTDPTYSDLQKVIEWEDEIKRIQAEK